MITQNQIYKFCTIFDLSYYSKGLALYYSLEKVCDFRLFIFTPDEKCFDLLMKKKLSKAIVVRLSEIEDEELKQIKMDRDVAEYFWTIKASCINFLFRKYDLDLVTYIDADIFFYTSPDPIFEEMGNNSVLITPHNFSPQYKNELKNGIYNAGFISYRNNEAGLSALNWWNDRCREWCYKKKENGKFGDQMYLNELSTFEGVDTLKHKGALANWNVQQFDYQINNGKVTGITKKGDLFDVIFFHFHYLKFLNSFEVELGRKYISSKVFDIFYKPYIKYLLDLAGFDMQGAIKKKFSWKTPILYLLRKLRGTYNIIPISELKENESS
ncbi:MAG: glycosyl transferase [bacterium]|nr:glycosyl transferase [bacterium]